MRRYILPMFDVVVFGSFAVFLAMMALSIPTDARLRLLARVWELVRISGGW
ncbi:hypothetical protein G3N56_16130 [Desulfovibrio sulfodismutans]|uniref:Uncharacterized protein n=1 Tax=Desulfolutivibrio sulfodismutans TaxID=63561 RepID=A0A7K3NPY2_9BACT|nr:hypothetical protein [Desulfolutivibrio sulfodismutans]NDY58262.1 hypothetical protein [Desulfolutivibrio sulfodismutans]